MKSFVRTYDIIVIGAGHAGCEAALAAARMGCRVLLTVIDLDKVAAMPCSPLHRRDGQRPTGQGDRRSGRPNGPHHRPDGHSIPHPEYQKGDRQSSPTRTQNDKSRYHTAMKRVLENTPGLDLKQAMIEQLVVEDGRVVGVVDHTGFSHGCRAVIPGNRNLFQRFGSTSGDRSIKAGRAGEFASYAPARQPAGIGVCHGSHENRHASPFASGNDRFFTL